MLSDTVVSSQESEQFRLAVDRRAIGSRSHT